MKRQTVDKVINYYKLGFIEMLLKEITVGATSGRPLKTGLQCKPLRKFVAITLLKISGFFRYASFRQNKLRI